MTVRATSLRLALSASAIALFAVPGAASAATCTWLGGAGNWSPAGGWGSCTVPAAADNVSILAGGSVVNLASLSANAFTINLGGGNIVNLTNSNLFVGGGAITNNGTFNIAANSNLINSGAPITVGGTGVFALNDIAGVARIYGGAWTFGSGQTIRGAGQVGINSIVMTNHGLVSADFSGRVLSADVAGGSGGIGGGLGGSGNAGLFNTGTMQATGGGILNFESGRYENSATGVIQALNGSVVNLNNDARIVGGTLKSVGTGEIRAFGATQYLNDVTLASGSNLLVRNNNLYANNTLVNNGTITLGGASGSASLINEGATLTISGTGTIRLDDSAGAARIYGGNIIFGSNQSIVGSGQLGINSAVITNNGLFSANSGSNLSIDTTGGSGGLGGAGVGVGGLSSLLNNNNIEATGGSTISFESGRYENALGSIIRATTNSFIKLNNDARIIGGTLSSDATSSIEAFNATQYLNDLTLSSGSKLSVQNNNLFALNTLTNNGTITLGGASGTASLINENAGGTLLINGTGTIILDNSFGAARIYNGNITFGAGQTVQGAGQLGINSATFTINNVFSANTGSTLSFDVTGGSGGIGGGLGVSGNAGMLNNSTIQATGGSTISFESGRYENAAGGVMQALAGSVLDLNNDARIVGGTLKSVGTGEIRAFGATQYLNDVTLATGSSLLVRNNNLYALNTLVNNGTITLGGSAGTASLINETGTLTISGTGTIRLDDSAGAARIYNGNIIFGSNQLIVGSGQLGINSAVITNNGLFSANSGSNLSIDTTGGSGGIGVAGVGTGNSASLLNNNIIEATGNSTVSFESGLYENVLGGIIRATNNSFIKLNNDSRILNGTLSSDATSQIEAFNATQYLSDVTLSSGSKLLVRNNNLYAKDRLTNNGTITLGGASGTASLINETGALSINGSGTIVLDDSLGAARIYNGNITFGAAQTVRGSGQIGINSAVITNNGLISADAGTDISVDVTGGSGGLGAGGVGTTGAGLFNTGSIQAKAGYTLSMESGRYENSATGTFGAIGAFSRFVMGSDANLTNLQTGGVLSLGNYVSSTDGLVSTLRLRSSAATGISTIGTAAAGTDTTVTLSGTNSFIGVTDPSTGIHKSIDGTLFVVADSGQLNLLDGRNMTIFANSGNFTNSGLVQLGGSAFAATSVNNLGTLRAISGVNSSTAVTGSAGTIETLSSATLNLGGASTAGFLTNNGTLGLGTNNITVTSDYTNAAFGTGNAFNHRANVTGSGLLLAANATMDLTGTALSGGILNVGSVRTGGSSSTVLTITNNGTATTLRGAVQNALAPSVALTGADWVLGPGGASTNVTISYTGLTAGSLAGQTLNVVNNFDNVADQTIGLAGSIYQVAQAGSLPTTITLGARRVGDAAATAGFSIANVAPITPGFNENLQAVSNVAGGFTLNGAGSQTSVLGAGSAQIISLSHGTGTAGAFASTVNVANTTLAVAGSGLSDLALAGQSIGVIGNVYQAAVASLSGTSVNFGVVRQGSASPTGSVSVTNTTAGALTDKLTTTTSGLPAGVTGTAPGALASGASGNASFALNTSTAGVVSGTGSLDFKSTNAEMADLTLASQSASFTGTITELAQGSIFKNGGAGAFAGSGGAFTLNLGSLASGSGIFSTDLGVSNLLVPSAFAETLGGSFTQGAGAGYTFAGNTFSGLLGGTSNLGNFLSFDTTGLSAGTYTKLVTFNGFSRYAGLTDYALSPINVSITATVTGGGTGPGAVPEPMTWVMMLFGFGLVGSSLRRNRLAGGQLA